MDLKEANNKIEAIDNKIEYYLKKKELEFSKLMPQSIEIKPIMVDGGKRVDKFTDYTIELEEIDKELDNLYAEKQILEEYVQKELIRLGKYREVEQLIVYYKEQCLEEYTWLQISQRVHYSQTQCRNIYRRWKKQRTIDS